MTREESPQPLTRSASHGISLPLLLAALSTLGPFAVDTYLPSFLDIGERLSASRFQVQQTLTAYLIPFTFMTLWHGAISDAFGRRSIVLVSLVLFAAASVGAAMATSIEQLFLFRALQGLVAGAGVVVGRAVIRDVFTGSEAQRVMSHVSLLFAIAPAVAPVLGGFLQDAFGWRSVFLCMGGMALLLVMWAFAQLKETLPLEEREPLHPVTLFRNYMEVFKNGRFNVIALAVSCNFGAVFIYIAAAPEFLMRELGLQETEFYWLFGPATFGMMTGSWLSGRLAGRITRRATIRLSFVILIVAAVANVILSFAIPPQIPWSVLPLYFYGAGIALAMPSMTLSGLEIFHERRGLAASCQSFLMTSLSTVVASILAPLTGGEPRRLACAGALLLAAGALGTLYFFSGGHYLPEEMLDGNSEA